MAETKRGATNPLAIRFKGLDMSQITSIDLIFKAQNSECAKALLEKRVISPGEGDTIEFELTPEETYKLPRGTIYIDAKPNTANGKIVPVKIAMFRTLETLFAEGAST